MESYLFAYGTLRPGFVPSHIEPLISQLRPVGPAWTPGRLHHLGDYPGAVFEPSAETRVLGYVYQLPTDADAIIERLDAYEGFLPEDSAHSLFVRVVIQATLADGSSLACWSYRYNRDFGQAPLVPGGDYAKLRA